MIARRRRTLTDDPISELIRGEDDGEKLDHDELLSLAVALLGTGTDTTRHQRPPAWTFSAIIPTNGRLLDQLELVPHAVGEAMRYRPIGFALPRIATEYLELAGVRIPAGTIVFANTAAANRDPAAFSDPDRFDITRDNMVGTLSFGNGAHYCLGSHLARLELAQAPDRDGPAHAQPAPYRTSPVVVDDRGHRTHPLCPSNSTPDTEPANQPRAE